MTASSTVVRTYLSHLDFAAAQAARREQPQLREESVKKEASESFMQVIVRDEGVKRACADFVIAVLGAFTTKSSSSNTTKD